MLSTKSKLLVPERLLEGWEVKLFTHHACCTMRKAVQSVLPHAFCAEVHSAVGHLSSAPPIQWDLAAARTQVVSVTRATQMRQLRRLDDPLWCGGQD